MRWLKKHYPPRDICMLGIGAMAVSAADAAFVETWHVSFLIGCFLLGLGIGLHVFDLPD